MSFLLRFIVLFFLGSIPTAYLAGKWIQGKDLRQFGSGNVGATNAFRVLGKKAGSVVFLIDFLKGYLPILVILPQLPERQGLIWLGLAPILGHIFTPFLAFKGGKGVATGLGVLGALFQGPVLIAFVVWIVFFLITRTVSTSSLFSLASIVVSSFILGIRGQALIFLILCFALIVWTHRENLIRLKEGKENKFCK